LLADRPALAASLGCRTHAGTLPSPHILATGSPLPNEEVAELDLDSLSERFRGLGHCQALSPAVLKSKAIRGGGENEHHAVYALAHDLNKSTHPLPSWVLLGCSAAESAIFFHPSLDDCSVRTFIL